MVRILEFLGQTVVRAAHLGDWGTPFGMLIEHTLDVGEEATHADAGHRGIHRVLPGRARPSSTPTRRSPSGPGGGW